MDELAKLLNFSYTVKEPADGEFGKDLKNGSWSGLIGMLLKQEADIIVVPMVKTIERAKYLDFTHPIIEDGFSILMKNSKRHGPDYLKVFMPLHYHVWITVLVSVLCVAIVSFIVNYNSPYARADEKSFADNLWHIYAMFLEQGTALDPVSVSSRALAIFWSLFTVIIMATYTANLTADLTVVFPNIPIKNLQDLAASTDYTPLIPPGHYLEVLFKNAKPGTAEYEISMKLPRKLPEKQETILSMVKTGGYVYMDDQIALENAISTNCHQFITPDFTFRREGMAFVVAKGSPYLDGLSHYLIKMQESGLFEKFKKQWMNFSSLCAPMESTSRSLQVHALEGIFLVVAVMSAVAVIVLIIECLLSYKMKQKETYTTKQK